jgi:hypothetical protein
MSSYDEGPTGPHDEPLSRDPGGTTAALPPHRGMPMQGPMHGPMQGQMQAPMYGYGQWEMRPRRVYPIETKPFFLTSEFFGALVAIAGIAITAASSEAFGAWRAWILITAITVAYLVSRGIAKSGTRSHADDPREHFDLDWGRDRGGRGHLRGHDR